MILGFIKPDFPNERRVAILPNDMDDIKNEILIERGFGSLLEIKDEDYIKKGAKILERDEVFYQSEALFSLKLIQPSDYDLIKANQIIIGWVHPNGSGSEFMLKQAIPKNLIIVDLDNISPKVYYKFKTYDFYNIPKNFIRKNSWISGFASVNHALQSIGLIPNTNTKVAILGSGNVSQGSFNAIAQFNTDTQLFYRKTMDQFLKRLNEFDIIINGIEIDRKNHILSNRDLKKIKQGCLIIDAAADEGGTFEFSRFTSIDKPLEYMDGIFLYCVNNAPSLYYRTSSQEISKAFSKYVYNLDSNSINSVLTDK